MDNHPRNTPHPWLPYQIVAVGRPDDIRWTVQYPSGRLHDDRYLTSGEAEALALDLKLQASREASICS